jgi:hypothetical protein
VDLVAYLWFNSPVRGNDGRKLDHATLKRSGFERASRLRMVLGRRMSRPASDSTDRRFSGGSQRTEMVARRPCEQSPFRGAHRN